MAASTGSNHKRDKAMTSASVQSAQSLFAAYQDSIGHLASQLGEDFSRAVDLMLSTAGHVVVCGIGKSGIIGRKISATLASTGTPSLFCIRLMLAMAI